MLTKHPERRTPRRDILESLEEKREHLYGQVWETGDFGREMISVIYWQCGKRNCPCAQEGHPGHGSLHLWNTTIKGKRYAKSPELGPELQKDLDAIANHHCFLRRCEELGETNERICDLRLVPPLNDGKEMAELQKKLPKRFIKRSKTKSAGS